MFGNDNGNGLGLGFEQPALGFCQRQWGVSAALKVR
jgi:hypothetical protein